MREFSEDIIRNGYQKIFKFRPISRDISERYLNYAMRPFRLFFRQYVEFLVQNQDKSRRIFLFKSQIACERKLILNRYHLPMEKEVKKNCRHNKWLAKICISPWHFWLDLLLTPSIVNIHWFIWKTISI